jgi:hypothetical protein
MGIAGLIAAAVGGAAEGYGKGAEMEMKKQSELDLRKQLMDAETERQLRVDEIKRGRDIAEEDRKMSSDYLTKVSAADLTKAKNAIANRKTVAPQAAEAADVEFEAGKGLEGKKATAATKAKITETTSLSGNKDYLEGTAKLSKAAKAAEIEMNQAKVDAINNRSPSGSSAIKVRSTYTNDQGEKVAVLSDGNTKVLGKSSDYDKTVSNIILKMAKEDNRFKKLPAAEQRTKAEEVLRGQIVVPSSGKDLTGLNDPKYLKARELDAN